MERDKYFNKIISFYRDSKRMPSYGEILKITGLKSKNAVYKLVNKMAGLSLVKKDKKGKLIPGKIIHSLKLLGNVEAGWPSPAEEELVDTMSLDEFLIRKKEATYMLKVEGDSMKEAGILPGDLVLVERGRDPKDGDIVIAEIDHEWTMKYFRKSGRKVYLEAANKKYRAIAPAEELNIAAVVIAVIRKYKT